MWHNDKHGVTPSIEQKHCTAATEFVIILFLISAKKTRWISTSFQIGQWILIILNYYEMWSECGQFIAKKTMENILI